MVSRRIVLWREKPKIFFLGGKMTTDVRLHKAKDPMDPRLCKAQGNNGNPCPYLAEEGDKYCVKHAARKVRANRNDRVMRYRLGQEKERLAQEMQDDPTALTLRDEIIVLRLTLQDVLTRADSEAHGFILNAEIISGLTRQIGSLVEKCFKLEQYSDEHLSRTQVLELANTIMEIVADFVTPEEIQIITSKISQAVSTTGKSEYADA